MQSRRSGEPQAVSHDALELNPIDADAAPRPLQLRPQLLDPPGQSGIGLAHRLEIVPGAPLSIGLLDMIDFGRHLIDAAAIDAAGAQFGNAGFDDRGGAAELLADDFGFFDEPPQHPVLRPLRVDEIAAIDARRRLQLAVDAAVALFETARVPWQVEVKQVATMALQV